MDKLAAMRAFVEIVDKGSITAAAEHLEKSQPALVRTLAATEKWLGVRLLQRTTRRMSLTPDGREFLERCLRILADVEEAEQALGQDTAEPRGLLRLSAPVQFGRLHLTPKLNDFLKIFGQVEVELLLLDRIVDLVEEGIDMALRIGRLSDSTMVAARLGQVRRMVCISPALLQASPPINQPKDLAKIPCVRSGGLTPGGLWRFQTQDGKEVSVRPTGRFSCNDLSAATNAVASGLGVGLFLSYQVQSLVRSGELIPILEAYEPPPLPVSLVYPESRLMSARLRTLVTWLKQAFQQHPAFELSQPPA